LASAQQHGSVLVTNGLDFSAILAADVAGGPSVAQLRTQELLSDAALTIVAKALEAHRDDIERGALLSIDEAGTRVTAIVLEPDGERLKITLKGNWAGMLSAARDSKRSPDTGDLRVQIKMVAGACNPLNVEFSWSAA
jgi:hypothetical protein